MKQAKIQGASHNGAYVIRFQGDIRLTLSASVDDYFSDMCKDPDFVSVWFDLGDVDGLDSTTLGILAKLAIKIRKNFGFSPAIFSSQPGITRLLRSMEFHKLFDLREECCITSEAPRDLPMVNDDEIKLRDKVIEAHKVLMNISHENEVKFKNLVTSLEQAI